MTTDPARLHREAFVGDLHCDTLHPISRGYDLAERHDSYHIDIPRLREGGIDLQVFAAFANPLTEDSPRKYVERSLARLVDAFGANSESLGLCRSVAEIREARSRGRIAAMLAVEGGAALENDPALVSHFHDLGVRIVTIVHDQSTDWCISQADREPSFDGLTDLGRSMIAAMNERGVIVDLSHSADSTIDAVLDTTSAPVIASHSCARALVDHKRNLTDQQARRIANSGGLIGVTYVPQFLDAEYSRVEVEFFQNRPRLQRELMGLFVSESPEIDVQQGWVRYIDELAPLKEKLAGLRPSVETVVDHIDHFVRVVGADHVGLGSDFDGITTAPEGLEDCSRVPSITAELVRRGYAEEDIVKILGENFLRVLGEVEKSAAK
jgi:membrane dipeptidase